MTKEEQEQLRNRYNSLIEKYLYLRGKTDEVKYEIQKIEGLVEYEQ